MRRRPSAPVLTLLLLGACTFASSTTDQGLPGVAGTRSDMARAQFAAVVLSAARGTMTSWERAVRGQGNRPLLAHYTEDAAVVEPGASLLKGPEGVRAFTSALETTASDAHASLLDAEVSEGIAYLYGSYDLAPARAGTAPGRGFHVTVLRERRGQWYVRTQLFDPFAPGPPLAGLPAADAPGMIELGTTSTGAVPREAFAHTVTLLASFARFWADRDARSLRRSFVESGLLQLPGAEIAARATAVPAALDAGLGRWTALETTELDFTSSGRLAVLLGRYALRSAVEPDVEGHYVLVAARDGNQWRIRSLVLD